MEDRPVFIIGSGRCGSTLVQRLLNSNPRFAICGEHSGFLKPLSHAYRILTREKLLASYVYNVNNTAEDFLRKIRMRNRFTAWDNFFSKDDVVEHFLTLIKNMFCIDDRLRWGFKEIRYGHGDFVINMLDDLFPGGSYIFVIRHPLDTITSRGTSFFQKLGEEALIERGAALDQYRKAILDSVYTWRELYKNLLAKADQEPGRCFVTQYEQMIVEGSGRIRELKEFLGEGSFQAEKVLCHKLDQSKRDGEMEILVRSIIMEEWSGFVKAVSPICKRMGYELDRSALASTIVETEAADPR